MIILVTTENGKSYARRIGQAINVIGKNKNCDEQYRIVKYYQLEKWVRTNRPNPRTTLIHSRAAHPGSNYHRILVELEEQNFKVVNTPRVLDITSNKWVTYNMFKDLPNMPQTIMVNRNNYQERLKYVQENYETRDVIIKQVASRGNGEFVYKLPLHNLDTNINQTEIRFPFLIQEVIPINKIYRVFVFGGQALSIVTQDTIKTSWDPTEKPASWKISVCLNYKQVPVLNPDMVLLDYAENIQRRIDPSNKSINFIDIFETDDGYVLSEINTACNLTIHEMLTKVNISAYIADFLISQNRR